MNVLNNSRSLEKPIVRVDSQPFSHNCATFSLAVSFFGANRANQKHSRNSGTSPIGSSSASSIVTSQTPYPGPVSSDLATAPSPLSTEASTFANVHAPPAPLSQNFYQSTTASATTPFAMYGYGETAGYQQVHLPRNRNPPRASSTFYPPPNVLESGDWGGDWTCPRCQASALVLLHICVSNAYSTANFARRIECYKCNEGRPNDYVDGRPRHGTKKMLQRTGAQSLC